MLIVLAAVVVLVASIFGIILLLMCSRMNQVQEKFEELYTE